MSEPTEFFCEVCGRLACFGFGRLNGQPGRWFCAEHQTKFNVKPAPPPTVVVPDDIRAMSLFEIQTELRTGTPTLIDAPPCGDGSTK